MPIKVTTGSGGDARLILRRIRGAAQPTVGDALYGGQRQRTRILDRTARGVDAKGSGFKPYSEKGPYYYNPNGRLAGTEAGAKVTEKQQKAAAKRFLNKITTKEQRKAGGGPKLSRTGRSIKFESYGAFKRWLGRSGVDLRGPKAPHMLQGIIVKAGSVTSQGADVAVSIDAHAAPAGNLVVGVYGEAARIAAAHNAGGRNLPQRKFFSIGPTDARAMAADVLVRIRARMKRGG